MLDKLEQKDIDYIQALLKREIDEYGNKYDNGLINHHVKRCVQIKRKIIHGERGTDTPKGEE